MEAEGCELVSPSPQYREAFRDLAGEYRRLGSLRERRMYTEAVDDFPRYLRQLKDFARGVGISPDRAAFDTYWLLRRGDGAIVATSTLFHGLTAHLLHEGGHIGYGVRPSQRRKGYGTLVCRLTLEQARRRGIKRVLITCDSDNLASARIIEKNGGVMENQVTSRETGKVKNRYWIDLEPGGSPAGNREPPGP